MNYEKSCGAIIFHRMNDAKNILIIKNRDGKHWGFPKGHVEASETEHETAIREVFEEVGLSIEIKSDFRYGFSYQVNETTEKEVVYFLAESTSDKVQVQYEEVEEFKWCTFEHAARLITYEDDLKVLIQSQKYI